MPESFARKTLTEATFLILISLCEPRHGYGVMQYIAAATNGRVTLGAGTLYGAINLLLDKGWIEHFTGGGDRKKMYRLTQKGMNAVEIEMNRFHELLAIGNQALFDASRSNGPVEHNPYGKRGN